MPSTLKILTDKGLIHPPKFLPTNVHYETIVGSVANGTSVDGSDYDIYGFGIPPRDMIFSHLAGDIEGFGRQKKRFNQYQQHHIKTDGKEYDLTIYNIVRYFHLCMECNPNMVSSLFTPRNCVLHITQIGERVREFRKEFLHKGAWIKFKSYSYSQLNKALNTGEKNELVQNIRRFEDERGIPHNTTLDDVKKEMEERGSLEVFEKTSDEELISYHEMFEVGLGKSKRFTSRKTFNVDVKFLYHVVRLLDEVEQILVHRDIDLQRNREQLKAIRRGEMSFKDVAAWATEKEAQLEKVYAESKLPWGPDEGKIKNLLLECLEMHYGSLDKCIVNPDAAVTALRQVSEIIEQNRKLLG
jgi:uncharacterized protein